jgi:putative lipoic acid-binding regulatory protein
MGARVDGFAEAMVQVARQFDPEFDPATLEMRPSKAGNYLSVTLTIRATSREQLDNMYLALTSHPMVKIAL